MAVFHPPLSPTGLESDDSCEVSFKDALVSSDGCSAQENGVWERRYSACTPACMHASSLCTEATLNHTFSVECLIWLPLLRLNLLPWLVFTTRDLRFRIFVLFHDKLIYLRCGQTNLCKG